jgi:hypothetical protein
MVYIKLFKMFRLIHVAIVRGIHTRIMFRCVSSLMMATCIGRNMLQYVTHIYIHDFSKFDTILVVYCQLHRRAAYNIMLWTYNWEVRGANTGKDRPFMGFAWFSSIHSDNCRHSSSSSGHSSFIKTTPSSLWHRK